MECVILSVELIQVFEEAQVKRKEPEEGKMAWIESLFFVPYRLEGATGFQSSEELTLPQVLSPNFSRQMILILFFLPQSLRL